MGPQEDYIETVVTCEGDFYDPQLPNRLESFRRQLKDLLLADPKKQVIVKKVEPWNSVRVTLNIPRQAALRLKQLAEQGSARLRQLGVLAVQIDGDHLVSLTLATPGNQRTELILRTAASSAGLNQAPANAPVAVFDSGLPSSSDELGSPGPSNVEVTRKNIEEYLRQGSIFQNSVLTSTTAPSATFVPASASDVFKTPSIVETSILRSSSAGSDKASMASSVLGTPMAVPSLHQRPSVSVSNLGMAAETSTFSQPVTSSSTRQGQRGSKTVGTHAAAQTMTPSQPVALPQTASMGFNMMCLPPPPPYPHPQGTGSPVANHIGRQGKKVTASSPLLINLLQTEPVGASSSSTNSKGLPAGQGDFDKPKKKRRVRRKKELTQSAGGKELVSDSASNSLVDTVVSSALVGEPMAAKINMGGPVDTNSSVINAISSGHTSELSKDTPSMPLGVDDEVASRGSLQVSSVGFSQPSGETIINPYTGHMEPRELANDLSPLRGEPTPLHIPMPDGSGVDMAVLTSSIAAATTTAPAVVSSNVNPPPSAGMMDSGGVDTVAFKQDSVVYSESQQRNFPSPSLVSVPQSPHSHGGLMQELQRRQHSGEAIGKALAPGGGMASQVYAQRRSSPLPPASSQTPAQAVTDLHIRPLPAVVSNHAQPSVNSLALSVPSSVPADREGTGEMHAGSLGMMNVLPASVLPVSQPEFSRLPSEPVSDKGHVTDAASDLSARSAKPLITDDTVPVQPDALASSSHSFLVQGRTEVGVVAGLHHQPLRHATLKSSTTAESQSQSLALLNVSPAPAVLSPPAIQRVAASDCASVGTASPAGSKTLSEGDDSSNHSCIGPEGPPDTTSTGATLLDGTTAKVYNNDSGVGSSSERSDDTPSEVGDAEYHSGAGGLGDGTTPEGGTCVKQVMGASKLVANCDPSTSKAGNNLTVGFVHSSQVTAPGMLSRKDAALSALHDAAAVSHLHNQSSVSAEKSIPAECEEILIKSMHSVTSSQASLMASKGVPNMAVQYLLPGHPDMHQQMPHHKNRVVNCQVSGVHQNGPIPHAPTPEQTLVSSCAAGVQVSSLPHTPSSSLPHTAAFSAPQPTSVSHSRGKSGANAAGLAVPPGGKTGAHVTSATPSASTMAGLPYMQGVMLSSTPTHSPSIAVPRTQGLAISHAHMSVLSSTQATSMAGPIGPVTTSGTGTSQNCVISSGHVDGKTVVVSISDSGKANTLGSATIPASGKQQAFSVATVTTATITTPTATDAVALPGSRHHRKSPTATVRGADLAAETSLDVAVSLPELMAGSGGEANDLDALEEAHQLFYGSSGEATSLSGFDEDLVLASHTPRDNGMVGYLEGGGRHSSSNGNGSISVGSGGGGTISAEVRNANITSMYCKRSSPVNVNMLNHIYAPGLPLPRRLTESVQRLVKPLPTTETALPPGRLCKSPGASSSRHSTNGSTSPGRASQGGARSPGASMTSARALSFDKAAVGPQNNMSALPSNIPRGAYHSAPYAEHISCDLNSMHASAAKTAVPPHLQASALPAAVGIPNTQSYMPANTCFNQQAPSSGVCTQSHSGFPQVLSPGLQAPWPGPHSPASATTGGRLHPPPPPLMSSTCATVTTQAHPASTSTPILYHQHNSPAASHSVSHIPLPLPLSSSAFHPLTTASVIVTASSTHRSCALLASSEQPPEVSPVSSLATHSPPGGSSSSHPSHPVPPLAPPVLAQCPPSPTVSVCSHPNSQTGSLDWEERDDDSRTQTSPPLFSLSHPTSALFIRQHSPHAACGVTTTAITTTVATSTVPCGDLQQSTVVTASALGLVASTVSVTSSGGITETANSKVMDLLAVSSHTALDSPSVLASQEGKNAVHAVDSRYASMGHLYSSVNKQAAEGSTPGSRTVEGRDVIAHSESARDAGGGEQVMTSFAAPTAVAIVHRQRAITTTADFSSLAMSQPSDASRSHNQHLAPQKPASHASSIPGTSLVTSAADKDCKTEDACKAFASSCCSPTADTFTTASSSCVPVGETLESPAVSGSHSTLADNHGASELNCSTPTVTHTCATVTGTSRTHSLLKHKQVDAARTNMHTSTLGMVQDASVTHLHLGLEASAQNAPCSDILASADHTSPCSSQLDLHTSSPAAASSFQVTTSTSVSPVTSGECAGVTSTCGRSVSVSDTNLVLGPHTSKTSLMFAAASVNSQDAAVLGSGLEMVVPDVTKNHVSLMSLAQRAVLQASSMKNLVQDKLTAAAVPILSEGSATQTTSASDSASVVAGDGCRVGSASSDSASVVAGDGCRVGSASKESCVGQETCGWGDGIVAGTSECLAVSTQPPVLSLSSGPPSLPDEPESSLCIPSESVHSKPPLLHPAPPLSMPTIVPSGTPPPPSLTPVLQEFIKKDGQMPSATNQASKLEPAASEGTAATKQGDKELSMPSHPDGPEDTTCKMRRITRKRRSTQSESDGGEPAPKLNSVDLESGAAGLGSGNVMKQAAEAGKTVLWDQPPRLSREGKKNPLYSGEEKEKVSSKTGTNSDTAHHHHHHHHHFERNIIEATPEEIAKKNAASSAGRRRVFYAYVPEKSLGQSYFDTPVLCGRTRSQSSTTTKDSITAAATTTGTPSQTSQIAGTSAPQTAQGHKEDGDAAAGSKRSTRSLRTKDSTDVGGGKRKRAKEHR